MCGMGPPFPRISPFPSESGELAPSGRGPARLADCHSTSPGPQRVRRSPMAPSEQGCPGTASISGPGAVVSLQTPQGGPWGRNRHIEMCPRQSSAEGGQAGPGGVAGLLYFLSQDQGIIVMTFQRHPGHLGHIMRMEDIMSRADLGTDPEQVIQTSTRDHCLHLGEGSCF